MMKTLTLYPNHTTAEVRLERLIRCEQKRSSDAMLSARLICCAAQLPETGFLGWQMILPRDGLAQMDVFAAGASEDDLRWIAEETASCTEREMTQDKLPMRSLQIYALRLPISPAARPVVGFGAEQRRNHNENSAGWPTALFGAFAELAEALRAAGGALRVAVGSAGTEQQAECRAALDATCSWSEADRKRYLGTPVRLRTLLALPGAPSLRLLAVIASAIPGAVLEEASPEVWNAPLADAPVLPATAARILTLEPFTTESVLPGVALCREPVKPIPADFAESASRGVTIGRAPGTAGDDRSIAIAERDLQRHWQIVGQTGTGKSTLLARAIVDAARQGYGLTFLDPHGTTIDTVLRALPKECAGRVRVVRLGDADHPVPINMFYTADPDREERTISDLCLLFQEIFDPGNRGICGPRWERWFSTFMRASLVLLKNYASFLSVITLCQTRQTVRELADAIRAEDPDLALTLESEYGTLDSKDFGEMINWCVCKLQRAVNVQQLRVSLGGGGNALDFGASVDTDSITLIDLASPVIGTQAARVVGTLLLMQLWNALTERREREKTHLIFLDEAHLFSCGSTLPRMLAEGRKFGIGMVLAHQHCGQLTAEVREALEANSANFSAFRMSARDAREAAVRLDDERFSSALCRLDAFRAVTTLSVDGLQSAPFTLCVDRVEPVSGGEKQAQRIERESRKKLSDPYRDRPALKQAEILDCLRDPERRRRLIGEDELSPFTWPEGENTPDWLMKWLDRADCEEETEEPLNEAV